jgi:NodT family efflux transporter outer membrane factor (OMF) lipoprotein
MFTSQTIKISLLAATTALLGACAVGPKYQPPTPDAPMAWNAPVTVNAEGAQRSADLTRWWQQFDDAAIARLIESAQQSNPTLAQAAARIAQARAQLAQARGGVWPSLDLNGRATRGNQTQSSPGPAPVTTSSSASLDAAWEIDLWGANAKTVSAAQARLQARGADWHDARTSLAAEVAGNVVGYRACVQLAAAQAQDLGSREQTAKLTQLKVTAGFDAPADARLIDASVADARQRLVAQQADCDLTVKALVALAGLSEKDARALLDARGEIPVSPALSVVAVPTQVLAQRPDVASAERELLAASEEIGVAQANRLPRISLLGSVGITGLRLGGSTTDQSFWSFGPSISLPLFDAGRRAAGVSAAQARFDEARAGYEQRVRLAVREVEEALVRLDSAARREADAQAAARDYDAYFVASNQRFQAGAASLLDLEQARRTQLAAKQALIGVQRERVAAWIALYKAVGGGWSADAPLPEQATASSR